MKNLFLYLLGGILLILGPLTLPVIEGQEESKQIVFYMMRLHVFSILSIFAFMAMLANYIVEQLKQK